MRIGDGERDRFQRFWDTLSGCACEWMESLSRTLRGRRRTVRVAVPPEGGEMSERAAVRLGFPELDGLFTAAGYSFCRKNGFDLYERGRLSVAVEPRDRSEDGIRISFRADGLDHVSVIVMRAGLFSPLTSMMVDGISQCEYMWSLSMRCGGKTDYDYRLVESELMRIMDVVSDCFSMRGFDR